MHYQRQRREGAISVGRVGRPTKYPTPKGEKQKGAPRITVRLDPHILEWVKDQGGAGFLRHVAGQLYELADDEDFQVWWERLSAHDS